MRYLLTAIMILMALSANAEKASSYKFVGTDKDGNATALTTAYSGKPHTLKENEYSIPTWDSFGITNEVPYIIKDGNDWRDMTPAEVEAQDDKIQEAVTEEAVADVDMDALFRTMSEITQGGPKTYEEVKAIFTGSVDPKKAKKKKGGK